MARICCQGGVALLEPVGVALPQGVSTRQLLPHDSTEAIGHTAKGTLLDDGGRTAQWPARPRIRGAQCD